MDTQAGAFSPGFRRLLDYAIFDGVYMLVYYWVNAFMNIYFTDVVGIPIKAVATLTLFVRIFDAINDPFEGTLADRTNSKWGKYRPWVVIGGISMSIGILLMFSINPAWSGKAKLIWMWITYISVTIASTCCYMPYTALNGIISPDSGERNRAASLRSIFSNIGGQLAGILAVPLIVFFSGTSAGPGSAKGYTISIGLCVLLFIPITVYSMLRTREVVIPATQTQTSPTIKLLIRSFFRNRCAVLLALGNLCLGFSQYGKMAMATYYYQYVGGDLKYNSYTGIINVIAAFIGSGIISNWIFQKTKHKGHAAVIIFAIRSVLCIPLYFFRPNHIIFWVFMTVSSLFGPAASSLMMGMVGDVADYGEYKFGIRTDGFISSFISLMTKAGGAIGPAILLIIIDRLGFVPNATTQNENVLNVLSASISLLISLCSFISMIIFLFYNLSDKNIKSIRAKLDLKEK